MDTKPKFKRRNMKTTQIDFLQNEIPVQTKTGIIKRPRGRPPGPRGFVFINRFRGALAALAACVRWFARAKAASKSALILRRMNGPRCAVARFASIEGRTCYFFASFCYMSARCYAQGGVL